MPHDLPAAPWVVVNRRSGMDRKAIESLLDTVLGDGQTTASRPDGAPVRLKVGVSVFSLTILTSALFLLALLHTTIARADNDIRLVQGSGYPICRAIVSALRKMPPDTDLFSWASKLPPIKGVTRPVWKGVASSTNPSEAGFSIQTWWASKLHISRVEETTLHDVHLDQPNDNESEILASELRIRRHRYLQPQAGTISNYEASRSTHGMGWLYEAQIRDQDPPQPPRLIDVLPEYFDVLIANRRPWFVVYPGMIGTLMWRRSPNNDVNILTQQKCLFSFPHM